uniref:Fatty acyl-CoA reductase n=1 Tax=Kalanchoe fedtschenkoi TaxID=63787 RepID=A0A7N0UTK1_KALFE
MESLFLQKTYSVKKLIYRSLPQSSSSLSKRETSLSRLGWTKCSYQNSSDNLHTSGSSPAPLISKLKKINTPSARAVSPEILTDYAVVTEKTSPVEEPLAKPASAREDHGIGIAQYLQGKNYFITGATGFLAKVFIEKMLRTTPTLGKIYLLIKAEDKAAAMERLQNEIIDCELFTCLKHLRGEYYQNFMMNKLVPVVGNVCEADLGMDADVAAEMANEVEVIVNSAANTRFDER